jgi:hypothetical protein
MEQLRVPRLLAGALAAVSGAVVASFFEVEGTLIGAALGSLLVAPAETLYTHSLVSAHTVARRSLLRRAGEQAGANEEGASRARPQPIRWRRVAVAALLAFGIAVGVITGVEALARQPLASLFGSRSRQGASTSVGMVVAGADRSIPPATRAPGCRPRRRRGPHRRRRRRSPFPQRPCRRGRSPAPRPQPPRPAQPPRARPAQPPDHPDAVTRGSWRPWSARRLHPNTHELPSRSTKQMTSGGGHGPPARPRQLVGRCSAHEAATSHA